MAKAKSKAKSKSKSKKVLQQLYNKSKKLSTKLNKTIKNKSALKKCEQFCKKDYMVELDKQMKQSSTKEQREFTYNTCKKTFCNEKCEGYDFFGDKQKQMEFQKKITNGFQNTYSKDKITKLQKRGALSGCVDIRYLDNWI